MDVIATTGNVILQDGQVRLRTTAGVNRFTELFALKSDESTVVTRLGTIDAALAGKQDTIAVGGLPQDRVTGLAAGLAALGRDHGEAEPRLRLEPGLDAQGRQRSGLAEAAP